MPITTRRFRLTYVLARYPAPTETFIAGEIAALRAAGVDLSIYAFRGRGAALTMYRGEWTITDILSAWGYCLRRSPLTLMRAFAGMVKLSARPWYAAHAWRHAICALPLVRRLHERKIDRVHAHFADIPADVGLFISRAAGVAYSFSAHARDVFLTPGGLRDKCAAADVVFACNEDAAAQLRRQGARVALLHHGLDFDAGSWDRIYRERRMQGIAYPERSGPARILAVGRFVPKKGLDVLIEALAILNRSGLHCSATLVGGGPEEAHLKRLIEERNLGRHVRLLGFLDHQQLAPLWREADVFVQPSVVDHDGDRDGIPNSLLEAMASGIPAVGSSLPGITEVLRDGETGFTSPAGDSEGLAEAIRRAASSRHLGIACAARDYVRTNFDVNSSAANMLRTWGVALVESASV